jgi:hypothetical protein
MDSPRLFPLSYLLYYIRLAYLPATLVEGTSKIYIVEH